MNEDLKIRLFSIVVLVPLLLSLSTCAEKVTYQSQFDQDDLIPVFSPPGGTYHNEQYVNITTKVEGATIRYTLDGSAPTDSSTVYSDSIYVSMHSTIKAKATKLGWVSKSSQAVYSFQTATPSFHPPAGEYTEPQRVAIRCATNEAIIRFTTDGNEPTESSLIYESPLELDGNIKLKARAFKEGLPDSDINKAKYSFTCSTPVFYPPGGEYFEPQIVDIVCLTEGAIVRYTIDGSEPSATSTVFSAPIEIKQNYMVIKAKAFKDNWTSSDVATSEYVNLSIPPLGQGSTDDPYRISSIVDLKWIASDISRWDYHYLQTKDIDAITVSNWTDVGWPSVGNSSRPFTGSYNGNYFRIYNLTIDSPSNNVGFFGVTSGSTLRNLRLADVHITGNNYVGSLVGFSTGCIIENIHTTGFLNGRNNVGGLIGYSEDISSLMNNRNATNIIGSSNIGGVVGHNRRRTTTIQSSIMDNTNVGRVTASGNNVGGIIGLHRTYRCILGISGAYNTGIIIGSGYNTGGVIGSIDGSSNFSDIYNKGIVTGLNNVGGIFGLNYAPSISSTIYSLYSGGNSGSISGSGENIGGLIGFNNVNRYTVYNSYNKGTVSGGQTASNVGGIIGNNYATCYKLLNEGEVTGTDNIGGLIGYNEAPLRESFNKGNVNSTGDNVGGLIGRNLGTYIRDSYNIGSVTSTGSRVGGVIGWTTQTVSTCFNAGSIVGRGSVGGLLGSGNTSNCYWDVNASDQDTCSGGSGSMPRTTAEMTYPYAASTFVDWDFVDIWAVDESHNVNNGYPFLRWQIDTRLFSY